MKANSARQIKEKRDWTRGNIVYSLVKYCPMNKRCQGNSELFWKYATSYTIHRIVLVIGQPQTT